ncbi:MAG: prolipoprotein diacylglyceryl transferase [Actinobacteria bacterium]|nr:prolipoprotein diacylglyceryl transferase [Actinomycetota bacterium]
MRPIPTAFQLGPLELHTYGIGLALTFWFAYRYFERRLAKAGFETEWLSSLFIWVIVSALSGARVLHLLSQFGYYSSHPSEIFAIWHGGLSSFGGLLFAVPTALFIAHRRCPSLGVLEGLDIVAPVLMAAWAIGRLLGPQMMYQGGGHQTQQWFGMYYDGQYGKRIPVPLIQAIEDFGTYLILIFTERKLASAQAARDGAKLHGAVIGLAMLIWGISRGLDERLLLGESGHLGSLLVQGASVGLIVGGSSLLIRFAIAWKKPEASSPASS